MVIFGTTKIRVVKVDDKWLEAHFEWPADLNCFDDDGELLLSLLLVWKHIPWDKLTDNDLWKATQSRLDQICHLWLQIKNNFTELPNVHHHSIYMLAAMITRVWQEGLDLNLLRTYKVIFMKAAHDLEKTTVHGYRKLIQVQTYVGHRAVRDGHVLRKVPTRLFVAHIYCLNREKASLEDMTEYVSIQNQGEELLKESVFATLF